MNASQLHPIHINSSYPATDAPYAVTGRVGSPGIPIFTNAAAPAEMHMCEYSVECSVTGVACGQCSTGPVGGVGTVRHATVAHVRECCYLASEAQAQYLAELPLIRAGWI